MKYFKYALPHDTELENLPAYHGLVNLGHPVLTEATEDTEATYDTTTILVDVIWSKSAPTKWKPYRIKPSVHKHWFSGNEALWEACNAT